MALPLKISQPLQENSRQAIYNDGSFFFEDTTKNSQGYTHTISADGWFDTCSFTLKGSQDYLDDWFRNGLIRDVRKENPQGVTIWRGLVHRLSYNRGRTTRTKSIDQLTNRLYVRHSPILGWITQTTEGGDSYQTPVTGPPAFAWSEDTDSVEDWGFKTQVINGGERTTETAIDWASTIINEVAVRKGEIEPQITDNPFATGDAQIQVDCKGYWHMLDWVPYVVTTSGRIAKSEVIKLAVEVFNLLNAGYFDEGFSFVDSNPEIIQRNRIDYPTCLELIKSIVQTGGSGGYRWIAGILDNQQIYYKRAQSRFLENLYGFCRYTTDANSTDQKIYDECTGAEVKPWDLKPDNILVTRDKINTYAYIEQSVFTEPYQYQLIGSDDSTLSTILNRKGLPNF